jgi:hypothetical protein
LWVVLSGVHVVDNFVCREKGQSIWIVLEGLNVAEYVLEIASIIACPRFGPVDGHLRSVDIENDIDSSRVENTHA